MERQEMKKKEEEELKHLGMVRVAAVNTIMWLSNIYDYGKNNSGPLRSAVGSVEGAVTTVVSPVFYKFKDVPHHLLVLLDQQVDVANAKFDEHAPPLAKKAAHLVHDVIEKTAQLTKAVVHETQVHGPLAAARYAAKESTELVLDQSIKVWSKLDQYPSFHKLTEKTVPIASNLSEKYNNLVVAMRGKGYQCFSYVPLIPSDEIAKTYNEYRGVSESDDTDSSVGEVSSD